MVKHGSVLAEARRYFMYENVVGIVSRAQETVSAAITSHNIRHMHVFLTCCQNRWAKSATFADNFMRGIR